MLRTIETFERLAPVTPELAVKLEAMGIEVPRVTVRKHVRDARGGQPPKYLRGNEEGSAAAGALILSVAVAAILLAVFVVPALFGGAFNAKLQPQSDTNVSERGVEFGADGRSIVFLIQDAYLDVLTQVVLYVDVINLRDSEQSFEAFIETNERSIVARVTWVIDHANPNPSPVPGAPVPSLRQEGDKLLGSFPAGASASIHVVLDIRVDVASGINEAETVTVRLSVGQILLSIGVKEVNY